MILEKSLPKNPSYIGDFKFHLKLEEELINQSRHRYTYRNSIKIGERNNFRKIDRNIQTIQDFSQGHASFIVKKDIRTEHACMHACSKKKTGFLPRGRRECTYFSKLISLAPIPRWNTAPFYRALQLLLQEKKGN